MSMEKNRLSLRDTGLRRIATQIATLMDEDMSDLIHLYQDFGLCEWRAADASIMQTQENVLCYKPQEARRKPCKTSGLTNRCSRWNQTSSHRVASPHHNYIEQSRLGVRVTAEGHKTHLHMTEQLKVISNDYRQLEATPSIVSTGLPWSATLKL